MTVPVLALELLYLIIDQVLESELQHYQHVFAPSHTSTAFELLATSHTFKNYLKQQDRFHKLRLWRLLNRIPRQFEPIQVAVGTRDSFTVLSIDMSTEKISNIPHTMMLGDHASDMTETFLVLQETSSSIRAYRAHNDSLVYAKSGTTSGWGGGDGNGSMHRAMTATSIAAAAAVAASSKSPTTTSGCGSGFLKGKKPKKDTSIGLGSTTTGTMCTNTDHSNNGNTDGRDPLNRITLALFPLATFLQHIQRYALHHDASVWLWKRSRRFFKDGNMDVLLQQQFKYILDTPRQTLIAWDRPHQNNFRFTENVLNSNARFFAQIVPSF